MCGILFLVRKFCNVEIMPMVVMGRWRHKGGPHELHPIFIFQTIFISNLITMIKRELRELVAKFDIIPITDMEEQAQSQSLVTGHVKRYTEDSNTAADLFR